MKKHQIIAAIRRINHTAQEEFLAQFSERELLEYLEHLNWLFEPNSKSRYGGHALVA